MEALRTYRYLRLAIVGMVVLLGAGVLHEWWQTGWSCLQPSVSDYYYTPARMVLVGSLVGTGVCMVVLRGSTDGEDILLNVAGVMAALVAFVPTPDAGSCRSAPMRLDSVQAHVVDNVFALLVLLFAVLLTAVLVARSQVPPGERLDGRTRIRLTVGIVVYLLGAGVFFGARSAFLANAHLVASVLLFASVVVVVIINAVQFAREHASGAPRPKDYANRYTAVAALMIVSSVVMLACRAVFAWVHAGLCIEGALVVLFGVFWVIQTRELWWRGIRADDGQGGASVADVR